MTHQAPASHFHEFAEGLALHYTLHDPQPETNATKDTLIFIHGSGPGASGWSNFKHNIAPLQAARYRCVVCDQ